RLKEKWVANCTPSPFTPACLNNLPIPRGVFGLSARPHYFCCDMGRRKLWRDVWRQRIYYPACASPCRDRAARCCRERCRRCLRERNLLYLFYAWPRPCGLENRGLGRAGRVYRHHCRWFSFEDYFSSHGVVDGDCHFGGWPRVSAIPHENA